MNIVAMSRREAELFVSPSHAKKYVIVSITSPDEEIASFMPDDNRIGCLRLKFDDTGHEEFEVPGARYFKAEDAERLVSKIDSLMKMGCETFYIHCQAGISRSRGIQVAMSAIHGNEYTEDPPRRSMPNPHVVRTYITAYNVFHGTSVEVPEKFRTAGWSPQTSRIYAPASPDLQKRKTSPGRGGR